jgi:hypothetical protein
MNKRNLLCNCPETLLILLSTHFGVVITADAPSAVEHVHVVLGKYVRLTLRAVLGAHLFGHLRFVIVRLSDHPVDDLLEIRFLAHVFLVGLKGELCHQISVLGSVFNQIRIVRNLLEELIVGITDLTFGHGCARMHASLSIWPSPKNIFGGRQEKIADALVVLGLAFEGVQYHGVICGGGYSHHVDILVDGEGVGKTRKDRLNVLVVKTSGTPRLRWDFHQRRIPCAALLDEHLFELLLHQLCRVVDARVNSLGYDP